MRMPSIQYLLYKAKQPNGGALSTQLRALDVVQMANRRALSAYKLRPYPGRVTLFHAQDPDDGYECAADNGWTEFAMGGIQIHEIPGEHQLIFAQPVRTLAEKLKNWMHASVQLTPKTFVGDRVSYDGLRPVTA
jgi:thioesterase domain-containing protein